MRVMVPKATKTCHDDHIFAGLRAVINGSMHGVQYIWDAKLSTENWGFLIVGANKMLSNEIN